MFSAISLGIATGLLGGIFGIGGGSIMIPVLIMFCGLTQHQAQGTSLAAMLPPVFILAVWKYHQAHNIKWDVAMWIALGIVLGGLIGGMIVQGVPDASLKKAFGIYLVIIGIKIAFFK